MREEKVSSAVGARTLTLCLKGRRGGHGGLLQGKNGVWMWPGWEHRRYPWRRFHSYLSPTQVWLLLERTTQLFPPVSFMPALPFASTGCCVVSWVREPLWEKPGLVLGFAWICFQLLPGLTVQPPERGCRQGGVMVVRARGRQNGPISALAVPPSRQLHGSVARSHCLLTDSFAPD